MWNEKRNLPDHVPHIKPLTNDPAKEASVYIDLRFNQLTLARQPKPRSGEQPALSDEERRRLAHAESVLRKVNGVKLLEILQDSGSSFGPLLSSKVTGDMK